MEASQTGASGAKTYIEMGWSGGHIAAGRGYDVVHRQLRSSALEAFQLDDKLTGRKYMPNMHTITTSEELKSRIKADVSATVPLEGVAIESTSSYLRTVETSKTNLTQVIEEIILDDPVRARALDIKLTAAATSLLGEDPKKFAEKYGEYFVYGYIARARFTAVCTIKASSETLCNVIKTKLAAKAGDAKSLAASLESENSSNKEHCQMNINLEVDRLEGDSVQHRPHFEIGELTKAYENFQNHFQTTPYVALLCHYSVVDGRFPLPQHQFQYLGSTLSTAYQSLYLAQNELSNSCMAQTTGCAARIAKACDMVKYLDVNDENAMAAVQKEVKECLDEVDRWRLRFDLQNDAKKLARTDIGDKWISSGTLKEVSSGKLGVAGDPKYAALESDVKIRREHFQREWKAKQQYQTYDLGNSQDSVIGFRIVNEWNNNENGWFKLHHGKIREDSSVKVEFCAETWRGASWTVEVWTVPKIMYEVKYPIN